MIATIDAIGPQHIHRLSETLVTVTVIGSGEVLSVQPDGSIQTRPSGSAGPYEVALLDRDRLIYAPLGAAGAVFILPYCPAIPNT